MQTSPSSSEPAHKSVYRDRSFWGITAAQFFTVFNDNFYKQIVLFVCVAAAAAGDSAGLQGQATIIFSLPFLLMSGFCGYLSDLISKRTIILIAKISEIVIMGIGLFGFLTLNIPFLFFVLFLMGVHSALFGPAKYGILPELFTDRQLPTVNGLFQMSMFISIILGLASSGIVKTYLNPNPVPAANVAQAAVEAPPQTADAAANVAVQAAAGNPGAIWMASLICIALAVLGLISATFIRKTPAAKPKMKFDPSDLILNKETRKVLWNNRPLLAALVSTSVFWATGGLVYPQAINEVGLLQLGLSEAMTGLMAAGTGLGIAVGCIIGMLLSKGRFNARLVRLGAIGMFAGLILLALPGFKPNSTLLGATGTALGLVWLGICAGLYSVPLQVFIQAHAPAEHKGRVIGAMNLSNWIGIFSSGGIFLAINPMLKSNGLPPNLLFGVGAFFLLPVVLFYWPKSEVYSDKGLPVVSPD